MKSISIWKTTLFSLAAFCLLAIASCNKNDDAAQDRVEPILGTWQLTAATVDPPIDWFGNQASNLYAQLPPCATDDLMVIQRNGAVNFDSGKDKCDPNNPKTAFGKWVLGADEQMLFVTENGHTESWKILELTAQKMSCEYEEKDEDTGLTHTFFVSFTKK